MTVEDMVAALHTSPPPSPGPGINAGVHQAAAVAIPPTNLAVRIPIVLVTRYVLVTPIILGVLILLKN